MKKVTTLFPGVVLALIIALAAKVLENLENAENARVQLNSVLDVSHQLDKYLQ